MLFQSRIDRAQKWLKERTGNTGDDHSKSENGEFPSMEDLRAEVQEEMDLEKGDKLAMLIAAFITILPACLVALLIMVSVLLVIIFM